MSGCQVKVTEMLKCYFVLSQSIFCLETYSKPSWKRSNVFLPQFLEIEVHKPCKFIFLKPNFISFFGFFKPFPKMFSRHI